MSTVIGQVRDFLYRTDFDALAPTKELPGGWAKTGTVAQNAVSTALYWNAALTGPIGGALAMGMGVGKMGWGSLMWGLGQLTSRYGNKDEGAMQLAIASSFMGSGLENLCVGAAASFATGVGQGIAGLYAARSLADVANNVYPDQLGRGLARS